MTIGPAGSSTPGVGLAAGASVLLKRPRRVPLMESLGELRARHGYLRATMPVDARTHQPYGLLHGGASVALAETLGSSAGMLMARGNAVVGLEINANHLRAVRSGLVTGTARPLHVGRSTQVWEIRIEDEGGKPVCISRITWPCCRSHCFRHRLSGARQTPPRASPPR